MEMHWFAAVLMQPFAVVLLIVVVFLSTYILYSGNKKSPSITLWQLASGYIGVITVCLLLAAILSYVSPEEAATKWHVPAEHYWNVLFKEFLVSSILLVYFSMFGVAIIGGPIVLALARRGLASVPWILAASVAVSVIVTSTLMRYSQSSSSSFVSDALLLIGTHLLLALGFCLGARLPWHIKPA